jgi:hypothetical protein
MFLALFSSRVCESSFSSASVEIIGDSADGSRKQLQIQDEHVMFGSQDRPSRWFSEKEGLWALLAQPRGPCRFHM